ncbi:MAG: PAS domain S-box protein [Campylobacterota bacterium]|nr:PAS domain S-box protein [Campylobacterota bacterium]
MKNKKFSYFILIITFIITITLLVGVAIFSIEKSVDEKISSLHKIGILKLDRKIKLIETTLSLIKNYSNVISSITTNLNQYDEKKISNIFEKHFLHELGIFQLRLLDTNGMELIRYELNDKYQVIKKTTLQDKSDRYYFKDAKNIAVNDIYFSKFDLNKENGKAKIPYKNTTRVIKKIVIDNKFYYIVINYNLTDIFKYSLSALLYDIYLIENNNQINVHLNDKYSFSKQKNSNIFLKDLIHYEDQFITKKKLKDFPYHIVIAIKQSKLESILEDKDTTILKLVIISIVVSLIISFTLLYLLERNLQRLSQKALKILKNEKFIKNNEFIEFQNILDDLELQYLHIQKSDEIISKNVIYSKTDLKGIITEASDAFCSISGYKKDELIGKPHNIIRHSDMEKSLFKDLWKTIKSGRVWNDEIKNRKKDGDFYWVRISISPQYDNNNNIEGYMAIRQDITAQKRVEELMQINREKDKQLFEQSKISQMGEMIGNIAHQWRQPLSTISTIASSVQVHQEMGILDQKEIPKNMKMILDTTEYLSNIINTFRDFLTEKKERKEVILQDRIDIALNIIAPVLKDSGINIYNNIDYENKIKITFVVGVLSEVIIHIINNAKDILIQRDIKYPWIKIELKELQGSVLITIEDNGGGVEEDIISKIFDPYFTTKHKSQGRGLGLHLSYKTVTESLKGKLYVKNSKDDKNYTGAKFFIELPLT